MESLFQKMSLKRSHKIRVAPPLPMTIGTRPKWHRRLLTTLVIADMVTLCLVFWLAYNLRFANPWLPYERNVLSSFYAAFVYLFVPLWVATFAVHGLYNLDLLFGGTLEYARIFNANAIGVVLLVFYSSFDRSSDNLDISRGWLIFVFLLSVVLVIGERFIMRRVVYALRRQGRLQRRVVIVGANEEGQAVAQQIRDLPSTGLKIVGYIGRRLSDRRRSEKAKRQHALAHESALAALANQARDMPLEMPADGLTNSELVERRQEEELEKEKKLDFPVLGFVEDLPDLVALYNIDEVIIAQTAITRNQLLATYKAFGDLGGVPMWLSPGMYDILTTGASIKEAGFVPLISLNRLRITGFDLLLKTLVDYVLIILSSPMWLLVMFAIAIRMKRESNGPVMHRRLVVGQDGRMFYAYKFRTMVVNGDEVLAQALAADSKLREEWDQNQKLKDDPRVTHMGDLLRRTSLDELPQIFNVLRGQMSLVGPRMIAKDELQRYGKWDLNLLTVKPGITGPWQVQGRSELPYKERVQLSMNYIRNYTVWKDIEILWQTVWVVFRRKGAY
jgi:lipopolysaccharide/colanic/teichoic acid biosynthesis glycosyltransferase